MLAHQMSLKLASTDHTSSCLHLTVLYRSSQLQKDDKCRPNSLYMPIQHISNLTY